MKRKWQDGQPANWKKERIKKMKKKVMCMLLTGMMAASMIAGCGNSGNASANAGAVTNTDAGTDTSGLPIVAFSLLDTPLHHLIWSASQSTKACLSPEWRETAPWGCVPDRTKYEFCSMFKYSTLSHYFQVKPAFFSRLFHVLPAEARRPHIFPGKAAG